MTSTLLLSLFATGAFVQEDPAAALKELKPKLRSKEVGERTATIAKLVEINDAKPDEPSLEATELVASALGDESYVVRTEAAKALAGRMHPEVSVRALVGALEQVRKDMSKLGGGGGGRYGGGGGDDDGGNNGKEDPKRAEQRKLRDELQKYSEEVVKGLGKLPDDRCVEALAAFLPQLTRRNGGELILATAQGLIAFDARAGVEAVVAKAKVAAAAAAGGGGKWGPDTTGKTLHDVLAAYSSEKGFGDGPPWSTEEAPDWEKWFAKNQKKLPAKLGKYDLARMNKG